MEPLKATIPYKKFIIIGTAYFSIALIDPLYNAYVPLFLADHLQTRSAIGGTMSLLSLVAPITIPIFAMLSDRTATSIGKRMPYIIVCLPLAAFMLAGIPLASNTGITLLIIWLLSLNVFRYAARGPIVSLMPDIIPPEHRSQANGVINMMGGMAAITVTVIFAPLVEINISMPLVGVINRILPFWSAAVLVLLGTVIVFSFIKEPPENHKQKGRQPENQGKNLLLSLKLIFQPQQRSALWVMGAVFVWFLAYRLFNPFITLYVRDVLLEGEAAAARSYGMTAIAQTMFAIPAGIIAAKLGRKQAMTGALFLLVLISCGLLVNHLRVIYGEAGGLYLFWILLFLYGSCWVFLITNCLPLLWEISGPHAIGMYTGIYYLAAQSGAVIGPGAGGALLDIGGFTALFGAVCCALFGAAMLLRKAK